MNCRGRRPSSASAPACVLDGKVWDMWGTWGHGLEVNVAVLGSGGTFPALHFHENSTGMESLLAESSLLSEPGEIPAAPPSHGQSWSEAPHSHCWTFPPSSWTPCPRDQIPSGFWSWGWQGWQQFLSHQQLELGSSGCSSPLCFPLEMETCLGSANFHLIQL